jgi:hypothetical protein
MKKLRRGSRFFRLMVGNNFGSRAINWLLRLGLNPSSTNPLTALTGTAATQVATSAVVVPNNVGTLITLPATYPAIEGAKVSYLEADGATLGAELITVAADRDFSSDTGFWSKSANTAIGDGVVTLTAASTDQGITRNNLLAADYNNRRYQFTFTITAITGGAVRAFCGGAYGTSRTVAGTYTETLVATGSRNVGFYAHNATSASFDNVSIREITPAYLATDTGATGTLLSSGLTRYTGATYGSNLGATVEPSVTNSALQSNTFTTTWAKINAGITLTSGKASPTSGGTDAWEMLETATSSNQAISQTWTATAVPWAISCHVKSGLNRAWCNPRTYDGTTVRKCYFNMDTGNFGTVSAGITTSKTALAGGWYRISATFTPAAGTGYIRISSSAGDDSDTYEGDITKGLYIYQYDAVANPAPTSPIATTTAAVTRAARYSTIAGAEIGTNITLDVVLKEVAREQTFLCSYPARFYYSGTAWVFTDGETTMSYTATPTANTVYQIDLTLNSGAWSMKIDGSEVATATTGGYVIWQ